MSQESFLDRRAADSGITADDAAAAVTEITGAAPRAVEQFSGGWGTVPFRVTAADGRDLIVRVAYRSDRPYEHEQRVMDFVATRGIPAPRVLGVTRVRDHPVSVLEMLPGIPWNEVAKTRSVREPEFAEVARSIGRLLRRIHDIDVAELDLPRCECEARDLDALFPHLDPDQRATVDTALATYLPMPEPPTRMLVHVDYGGDHVLVNGTTVTGVIDWEHAGLGDPARDLGWWRAYDDLNGGSYELLREGYGPVADPEFDARVQQWTLFTWVDALAFGASKGFTDGISWVCERIDRELARGHDPRLDR